MAECDTLAAPLTVAVRATVTESFRQDSRDLESPGGRRLPIYDPTDTAHGRPRVSRSPSGVANQTSSFASHRSSRAG
jgi:hypothetical protein